MSKSSWYCEPCNRSLSIKVTIQHLQGKKHARQVAKVANLQPWTCNVCNRTLTLGEKSSHEMTRVHKRNLKKAPTPIRAIIKENFQGARTTHDTRFTTQASKTIITTPTIPPADQSSASIPKASRKAAAPSPTITRGKVLAQGATTTQDRALPIPARERGITTPRIPQANQSASTRYNQVSIKELFQGTAREGTAFTNKDCKMASKNKPPAGNGSSESSSAQQWECKPCDISMPSKNMQSHVQGRKHRATLQLQCTVVTGYDLSKPSPPSAPRGGSHQRLGLRPKLRHSKIKSKPPITPLLKCDCHSPHPNSLRRQRRSHGPRPKGNGNRAEIWKTHLLLCSETSCTCVLHFREDYLPIWGRSTKFRKSKKVSLYALSPRGTQYYILANFRPRFPLAAICQLLVPKRSLSGIGRI